MPNRNGGAWTEARFRTHIKNALREASIRWQPRSVALNAASVDRGTFLCAECQQVLPKTFPKGPGDKARPNNRHCDHVVPVVDPAVGFDGNWTEYIERMFVEAEGFQILCKQCHTVKTAEERAVATARRRAEKALAKRSGEV